MRYEHDQCLREMKLSDEYFFDTQFMCLLLFPQVWQFCYIETCIC
jgi:hypothetical protein